jgi:DNA-binding PadR family transcriptional regulator
MRDDLQLPSAKEAIALELLRTIRELYGLEMVKASEGKLSRAAIYVLLDRLEQKGFVKSRPEKEPNTPGMPRRLYSITGAGSRALAARRAAEAALLGEGQLA